jgi:hypothetical protein
MIVYQPNQRCPYAMQQTGIVSSGRRLFLSNRSRRAMRHSCRKIRIRFRDVGLLELSAGGIIEFEIFMVFLATLMRRISGEA